ncbi:alkaline phosphatase family protein [Aureibacter tunicatorum]|uniref:Alkaline phosphatase n=1 Tax=Aureibacter tunicatorum TaxID=866807 RepID=A0AAE3XPN1_9BACT|nr:alkaline phosphatase family protein [Aureibacter tunicatorum]MDR6240335.1 hypothetical protein [Aureibacter tunicatorum]BDD05784.1 alkaline phosphatase family protein [Aureibacter tunicatorum]
MNTRHTFILAVLSLILTNCKASKPQKPDKPKLIVSIVVDQMRYDYLDRFKELYTQDGFNRLRKNGFDFRNTHYNYIPTRTAPGHASLFTGTTPSRHGIGGNGWFDKNLKKGIFSISDTTVHLISHRNKSKGSASYSPANLLASTVGDELKLATYGESKVIGIGIKARASVLTSGHAADAAYWISGGELVTSSYYRDSLPQWAISFNGKERTEELLKDGWPLLLPVDQYPASLVSNDNRKEEYSITEQSPVFPYTFGRNEHDLIGTTPFGNTLLTEAAIACIEGEDLGQGDVSDFLIIGYSATDYIGHRYGAGSLEMMDAYLRLDRDIGYLIDALDQKVGDGNYVIVLTADHGGMHTSEHLSDHHFHTGLTQKNQLREHLNNYFQQKYGLTDIVLRLKDEQVYLDFEQATRKGITKEEVEEIALNWFKKQEGIRDVVSKTDLLSRSFKNDEVRQMLKRGVYPSRSGDVFFMHEPGWQSKYMAANHGTAYTYDTHVPNVWYGWKIPQGESVERKEITSIAPTLSMMFRVSLPNASSTVPLKEVL